MLESLYALMPEIVLLVSSLFVLVLNLFVGAKARHFSYYMSTLAVLVTFVLCLQLEPGAQPLFSGHYINDVLSHTLKLAVLLLSLFAIFYANYDLSHRKIPVGEFYALICFAALGMMVMVSAHNLLMLYLGLELLSLPLYALVAIDRESPLGVEAAMKYFVLGALASGFFLYGISLVYGMTASIDYIGVSSAFALLDGQQQLVAALGLVFMIIATAFKLGAAPFHMWVPDVYEGAPTSVALFIAGAPKIAAVGMLIRLIHDVLPALVAYWQPILMILGVMSIVLGNTIAIAQTNLKRLYAYSAIAHAGFVLLGLACNSQDGYSAGIFYIFVYTLISAGGFAILLMLSNEGRGAEWVADLKGLNARNPWYAFVMLLLVFSMAGVPPTVGFYAKLSVLQSLMASGFLFPAMIAVLFSVIGAFYYLRLIKAMYFDLPDDPAPVAVSSGFAMVFSLNGLAALVLGLSPATLLLFAQLVSTG